MQPIEVVRQSLIDQLAPLDARATELQNQLAELEADRWKLKAALKALDAAKKPRGKATSRAGRPSPKQKDVRDVVTSLVTENPGLLKSALEDLTKDKLTTELGFDLKGFEMRWNEVLGSGDFKVFVIGDDECVKLASPPTDSELGGQEDRGVA